MRNGKLLVLLVLAGLGAVALTVALRPGSGAARTTPASLDSALAGLDRVAAGFPAPGDAPLAFPADHASKPAEFAESWLFAGLVHDAAGAAWGFQLALQRIAMQPDPVQRDSAWAARDFWRARLAIERGDAPAIAHERWSRAALGLAGATSTPAGAWVEDWRFDAEGSGGSFRLQGATGSAGLDLRLVLPQRGPVAVGRGPYRGYWWPGLLVDGALVIAGREVAVSGRAMLDRLWGRGLPTGRGQLALASLWFEQADGKAYRCEQLRRRAGGGTPVTDCVATSQASAGAVSLAPVDDAWRTLDGVRLPLAWALQPGGEVGALRLAPLSAGGTTSNEGAWSGVVVPADAGAGWGLLQLSNFAAP